MFPKENETECGQHIVQTTDVAQSKFFYTGRFLSQENLTFNKETSFIRISLNTTGASFSHSPIGMFAYDSGKFFIKINHSSHSRIFIIFDNIGNK